MQIAPVRATPLNRVSAVSKKLDPALRRRALLAAGLALAAPLAFAQSYPSKPVRLLVGYNAGGGVDAMARMLAQRLSAVLGQQVVIENRSGASGMIAADLVAKSPPDGYTLLMGESGMLINSILQPRAGLDPIRSFTPVAGTFIAPLLIVANNDFPASNPEELVSVLKANPGRYSYATSGVGTVQHLGFELLKAQVHAFIVHIPYRGAAQIVPDVISGQVPLGVVSAAAGLAQAKAGRLKAVAVMSTGKLAGAESIAPMADALPGFDVAPRLMLLGPAGMPAPVVGKISEATRTVLASADLANAAAQQGGVPAYLGPDELGPDLGRELAEWARIVKAQRISVE
ncbi:Bug family tripartite tricarboxylate transporter substrate binding protein [Ramlibacter sp. MMS24-I3-19]|uniref:Bug family tripartite tricarboxylate transporter substrate binding protein n=1 Tax=Ramlibacter sp. MMS24-I3-19 TaxID=3416606 RepID=UPI003CFCC0DF